MDFKLLGSILLIVGTSIGAGMLALPIATAELGFTGSLVLLFVCWFIMTAGAFLLLEVNLWLPTNSNLISMAGATIGPIGQFVAWLSFLMLLYSLLCAYISGGSDLFRHLADMMGFNIPVWASSILFTIIFGSIVYLGIRAVDYVNRGLMFVKFGAYFLLVALLVPYIDKINLLDGSIYKITSAAAITVTITSFGYAAIVPSLRVYFAGDVKKLKQAIVIGSLIPLFCYVAWDMAIMGVLPLTGEHGLISILNSEGSTSTLVSAVSATANSHAVNVFAKLFTSVCVLTSFLGVALCLADFWADAIKVEKVGLSGFGIHTLALLPPLIIVLFFPNIFIKSLEYAGIDCIVLLIMLPAWMAWNGRYSRHFAGSYRVAGGKVLLAGLLIFSAMIIIRSLLNW